MKLLEKIGFAIVFSIAIIGKASCGTISYVSAEVGSQQYINPPWAPPYAAGVRYYYLPDIEAYYDLSNQDFVYLENGQWLFSSALPPIYSWYDLYDGFTIALNVGVFQPWMHNQFYISHYPRYYYRNKYNERDLGRIRGFNENDAKPFYWTPEDRSRITQFRNNTNNRSTNTRHVATRPPQRTGYYGKDIGRPVKVQPQMRENPPRGGAGRGGKMPRGGGSGRERGR